MHTVQGRREIQDVDDDDADQLEKGHLASGFWLLASGFWLLASGFWLLATGMHGRTKTAGLAPHPGTSCQRRPSRLGLKVRQSESGASLVSEQI